MNTLWKYSYYVYLIIAAILVFEGVTRLGSNTKWGAILLGIAALVLVKFFVTKKFRKRIEERNQQR
jgi:positive regulator of sigma E activity